MNLAEFVIKVESFNANINIPLIRRAFEFSEFKHQGQLRASGEPYVYHCLEVAFILSEQHCDSTTVASGVLHDILEDTDTTREELVTVFGEEIAALVDGVTKISGYHFRSAQEAQAEYFRKMLIAMAKDIRVILIKLADRLHNMRTLEHLPGAKQRQIAKETREVYAPLAHRFGMAKVKWELEDLSFKYLFPGEYESLVQAINERRSEREEFIAEVVAPLKEFLALEGIKADIAGRAKHFDSIWRKMQKRNKPLEEIYDLLAIRVLVESKRDCYHVLGIVNELWTPVMDRFHDYIATPKSNGYQSLHTSVVGPHGRVVEIQIRTHAMHRVAEYGIASHWLYKEGKQQMNEADRQLGWLRQVLEWQKEMDNPAEFMEYLKIDLFQDEVFVFTPRGELKELPAGSTPIDFAYAVHTNVGHHCSGAKVNGRMVPLVTELHTGDEVNIVTSPHQTPHQDWLKIVKTSRARSKIKQWFRQKAYDEARTLGREALDREAKRYHLDSPSDTQIEAVAKDMPQGDLNALTAAIGHGHVSVQQVLGKIYPQITQRKPSRPAQVHRRPKGVRIQGLGDMMYRFAKCCNPLPGDPIVGFITRGRGVTIHQARCRTIKRASDDKERRLDVEWDVGPGQAFVVKLNLFLDNRRNLLTDLTSAVQDVEGDVRGADLHNAARGAGSLIVEVTDLDHLKRVIDKLKHVRGVVAIERARGSD